MPYFSKYKDKLRLLGVLIILYAAIYIIYTFPSITEFSKSIIGKNDAYSVIWNTYIFKTGIHSGKIWTTQQAFYPWGTSLLYHASTPLIGFLTYPFENKILLLNIFIMTMFVGSAIGGYWLAKQFVQNKIFAFICGFIFAFAPFKMARIEEHYTLISTVLIPVAFVFFMRSFSFEKFKIFPKIQSKKQLAILYLLGFLCIGFDYVLTFQLLFLCGLYLSFFYVNKVYVSLKKWHFWLLMFLFFIAMHFVINVLIKHGVDDRGGLWWSGKWIDFVIPYNSLLYNKLQIYLLSVFSIQEQTMESVMFLGYTFLICTIISLVYVMCNKQNEYRIKALVFSLLLFVLMTMPVFRIPFCSPIYPPTAIFHFLPFINNLRCPTRFVLEIMLLAPIIIFYVLENLNIANRYKSVVGIVLFLFFFVEYIPAGYARIEKESIPKVYDVLAHKPGESVLVYPLGLRDGMKLDGRFDIENLYYQTVYHKKTMGGYISRIEGWIWYVHYQNAFTNTLLQLEKDSLFVIKPNNYTAAFQTLKLDYVVIPRRYRCEKAALFLQNTCSPFVVQKEEYNGDLLLSLKR